MWPCGLVNVRPLTSVPAFRPFGQNCAVVRPCADACGLSASGSRLLLCGSGVFPLSLAIWYHGQTIVTIPFLVMANGEAIMQDYSIA